MEILKFLGKQRIAEIERDSFSIIHDLNMLHLYSGSGYAQEEIEAKEKGYLEKLANNGVYIGQLTKELEELNGIRNAFNAAKKFIDSHAADPDLTSEMTENYCNYMKALSNI